MTLKKKGLSKLIKSLQKSTVTPEKADKIMYKLAKKGEEELIQAYSTPNIDLNKSTGSFEVTTPNIQHDVQNQDGVVELWAEGEELLFYEFGTGITHNSPRDWENVLNIQVPEYVSAIGTYGKGYGAYPYWHYRNDNMQSIMTRGIVARGGFARAINRAVSDVEVTVKEVLK